MTDDLITWAIRHHVSYEAIAELRAMWGGIDPGPTVSNDAMNETGVMNACILEAPWRGMHLFRNNVGHAWHGKPIWIDEGLLLVNPTRLVYGLATGSSDLIGWRKRTITQADVGKTIAQFVSLEAKSPKERATKEQIEWLRQVQDMGGLAGVFLDQDEAEYIVGGYPNIGGRFGGAA